MNTTTTDAAELPMNCSIVETERTHLTRQEHALMAELLKPGASVEAIIPDDAPPSELWNTLETCVRGLKMLEARSLRLKPIIGRILLMFERKPSLYKELGYETYTDFMRKGVYDTLGLHHTSAYEGKLVAEKWPQITPDMYTKIGPKKLNIASKFCDGRSQNAPLVIETMQRMKVGEFKQYSEQRGLIEPGEADGATILINTNRAVYKYFKEFFGNPVIHQRVGSKDHGEILRALMQSNEMEWLAEGQELASQYQEAK